MRRVEDYQLVYTGVAKLTYKEESKKGGRDSVEVSESDRG